MKRTSSQLMLLALAVAAGAIPLLYGLIRAMTARGDLRAVWIALASGAAVAFAAMISSATGRPPRPFAMAAGLVLVATLVGGSTAAVVGASNVIALLMVAVSMGVCYGVSYLLYTRSRVA
jgi:hypothetical protein